MSTCPFYAPIVSVESRLDLKWVIILIFPVLEVNATQTLQLQKLSNEMAVDEGKTEFSPIKKNMVPALL